MPFLLARANFYASPRITLVLPASTTEKNNWTPGLIIKKGPVKDLKLQLNGQQKRATCFVTLLQNELESDVARFTTHVLATNQVSFKGGKTGNIAFTLVLQQCGKTSCTFFVACLIYLTLKSKKSKRVSKRLNIGRAKTQKKIKEQMELNRIRMTMSHPKDKVSMDAIFSNL